MTVSAAIIEFCNAVYMETSAMPNAIELAPVSFDTLCADLAPTMRHDDGMEGDWPESPKVFMATSTGYVVIRRGRA